MAIGDFLGKLKGEKAEAPSFLAIELTTEVIQAAVWRVVEGKTELVTTGAPVEWDGDDKNISELLSAADATVSSALEGLEKEPDQVIFGIESSWVEDGKIIDSKLPLIKQICKELELKPLGFVEIIDSVIRYLKMQEGTPATSLMIQVASTEIIVTLVRLGKIEGRQLVGRGDDIAGDVEEALTSLKQVDNLPSRILVFNSMHGLDDLVQNLVSYDWQKNFKFLHIPQVVALPKDIVIRSVAVGGGSEVAKSIGFEIEDSTTPSTPQVEVVQEESNVVPVDDLGTASDFGFGVDLPVEADSHDDLPEPDSVSDEPVKKPAVALPKLPPLPKFKFKLPSFKAPSLKVGVKSAATPIILAVMAFVAIIAGTFAFIWFVPKAVLTVHIAPKDLDESVDLTLSTSISSVNVDSGAVPAELTTHQVSGEDSVVTTGKKTIGDPARGEVTIYNRTSLSKTLSSGTVIASGNLKFTLDDNITIASKSAGSDYVDVPGKATVSVTAKDIGDASNLAGGTEFTIASFSKDTYVGKSEGAFKGGNSKEIRVASEADKNSLLKALTAKLADQARAELSAKAEPGTGIYIIESSAKLESENYNVKVGGESDSLIGKVEISLSALKYKAEDVENLVSAAIARAVPPGYQRTLDPPIVEIGDVASATKDEVITKAKVIIKLFPMVDVNSLTPSLRGNTVNKIDPILSSIPGYKKTDVAFVPKWLPTRLKSLPKNVKNISLKLVSD